MLEVAQRGQDQVAEAVSAHPVLAVTDEPIREDRRERGVGVGEREQAVANIARRQHLIRLAQAAGAAAVIGGGHDGREPLALARPAPRPGGGEEHRLEPAQQHGQARTAPERHDADVAAPAGGSVADVPVAEL